MSSHLVGVLVFVVVRDEHIGVEVDIELAHGAIVVGIHEHIMRILAPFLSVAVHVLNEGAAVPFVHVEGFVGVARGGDGIVNLCTERV